MRSSQYYVLDSKRGFIFIMIFYANLKLWRDIIIKGLYTRIYDSCMHYFFNFFSLAGTEQIHVSESMLLNTHLSIMKSADVLSTISSWLLIDSVRQRLWRRKFEKERAVNIHDKPSEKYLWTPNLRKHLPSMNTKNMPARCLQIQG